MPDKSSKTEQATPKRLRDAKMKAQVPKSPDLIPAVSLSIFTMLSTVLGGYILSKGLVLIKNSLTLSYRTEITARNLRALFINNFIDALLIVAPFALISMLLGVAINIAQTGFIITPEPLKPDLKRINPISGVKNLFSKKALFTLIKNVLKLILVFYLAYSNIAESHNKILNSGSIGTEKLFEFFITFVKNLAIDIVVVMLILAVVDYIFQKRDFKENLKMTKQEVKQEHKEMEGDPQVKSARRQRQQELSNSRMMADIPSSTVVVTNPTHIAVAIRYVSKEDKAPLVVAKGADYMASKIKEVAKENKVPIIENVKLARAVYKDVEVGKYIPTELYQAVAEILVLVYQINEKNKGKI